MPPDLDEIRRVANDADCLFTRRQVDAAIDRMSDEITAALQESNPLLICVMKGGVVACGCLLPRLDFPLQLDFLQVSRYGDETRGGALDWRVYPQNELGGRDVLLVDDVLDQGDTMRALIAYCEAQGAARVYSAVLVDKDPERKSRRGFRADFTGLDAPDRFLFGYGLDYRGYLRNAPGLFAVPEDAEDDD